MASMNAICRYVLLIAVTSWCATHVASCAHVQPVISAVKDCANQVTHQAALGVIGDVSAAVVCDAGSAENLPACVLAGLAAVAKQAGWAAVDCALAAIQKQAAGNVGGLPAGSAADETEILRYRRATAAIAWRSGPDGGSGTAPPVAP